MAIDPTNPLSWAFPGVRSSDAPVIASRSREQWAFLRARKLGVPDKRVIKPRNRLLMDMGVALEPLICREAVANILSFRPELEGITVRLQAEVQHPTNEVFYATMDIAFVDGRDLRAGCEGKFHSGDRTIESLAEFNGPQLNHQMLVAGFETWNFAILFGHYGNFRRIEVERDDIWLSSYQGWCQEFIEYVATGELPADMQGEAAAAPEGPKIKPGKVYNWVRATSQEATDYAVTILECHPKAALLEAAKDNFKALVPADATKVEWRDGNQSVVVRRTKAGLTLSVDGAG